MEKATAAKKKKLSDEKKKLSDEKKKLSNEKNKLSHEKNGEELKKAIEKKEKIKDKRAQRKEKREARKAAKRAKGMPETGHKNQLLGDEPDLNFFNCSGNVTDIKEWLELENSRKPLAEECLSEMDKLKDEKKAGKWRESFRPLLLERCPHLAFEKVVDEKHVV